MMTGTIVDDYKSPKPGNKYRRPKRVVPRPNINFL